MVNDYFLFSLNIAGVNSFIVLKENVGETNMKRRSFLQTLATSDVKTKCKKHTIVDQETSKRNI